MRTSIAFLFLLLILTGCKDTDHPGYDRLKGSMHYQLVTLGEEEQPVTEADYVSFSLRVFDSTEVEIARKTFKRIRPNKEVLPDGFFQLLSMMNLDDSLTAVGRKDEWELDRLLSPALFDSTDQQVHFSLRVTEVLTEQRLRDLRAAQRMLNDLELKEQVALNHLKDSLKLKDEEFFDGMYFRLIEAGNGNRPVSGAHLMIHYTSHFADGTLFEDTYRGKPLEYEVGRPDQVFSGFATGISMMSEGAKALFVIPSVVGYGSRGSTEGSVPPYSTLIYEVKLVRIHV